MNRNQFVRKLRKYARKNNIEGPEIDTEGGKGSHYRLKFNDRYTTLQSGELTPGRIERLCKQLNINKKDL